MPKCATIKPNHKAVQQYYQALRDYRDQNVTHEGAVETAFQRLLADTARQHDCTHIPKQKLRFYRAIEDAAHTMPEFNDKQHFLNTVYERFFQGYSVKVADTHGIVYTPQAIVDFMCANVEEVLQTEFGLTLGSPGVNILDPCTGTGNFIVNLIGRIPK